MEEDISDNFQSLASSKGLDNETIDALRKEDYDSEQALKEMSLTTDLPALNIPTTQQQRVERWVRELNNLRASGDHSTTTTLEKSDQLNGALTNVEECMNNLMKREAMLLDVKKTINARGLKEFEDIVKEKISEFESSRLNICVTGDAVMGKSSLVASLFNTRPIGKNKPEIKIGKLVMSPHLHDSFPNIILWDYPGVQQRKSCKFMFPKEKDVPIDNFDAMVICSSRRFSELDLWLAKLAVEHNLDVFYVRTKVDLDIASEKRDRGSQFEEHAMINTIKEDITQNLTPITQLGAKIFVLSTLSEHRSSWDFPRLEKQLRENPPKKNIVELFDAFQAVGLTFIEEKKLEIAKRIKKTAEQITSSNATKRDLLQQTVGVIASAFGLESVSHCELPDPASVDFDSNVDECTQYRWIGIWFFGIGFLFGYLVDRIVTKSRANAARSKIQEACEGFLKKSLAKISETATQTVKSKIMRLAKSFPCTGMNDIMSEKCP